MVLKANEAEIARGKAPGPLSRMPIDGLEVGQDLKGAVGEYEVPFAFKGKLKAVTIELVQEKN